MVGVVQGKERLPSKDSCWLHLGMRIWESCYVQIAYWHQCVTQCIVWSMASHCD